MIDDEILDLKTASEFLFISIPKLRSLVKNDPSFPSHVIPGRPGSKNGSMVRFLRSELITWLSQQGKV